MPNPEQNKWDTTKVGKKLQSWIDLIEDETVLDNIEFEVENIISQTRQQTIEEIKEKLNKYPARCKTCAKPSDNLKLGEAFFINALEGECFECATSHPALKKD